MKTAELEDRVGNLGHGIRLPEAVANRPTIPSRAEAHPELLYWTLLRASAVRFETRLDG